MAKIIHSLREKYPLKDLLKYCDFSKSTYMYFQKRFDRIDKDKSLEDQKLYLNPFLDMYNGEIISYSITDSPTLDAVITPLEKAILKTSDCKFKRIFHSDQDWAYQLKQYTSRLKNSRITQSMSRKGNCLDNSPMENFFGILKQEIYYGNTFKSFNELKNTIEEYIKYYNEDRIKAKLGYLSPVEYRKLNAS